MTAPTAPSLRSTVIARWYHGLAENPSEARNHFRTKVIYYRAAAELLAADPARPLTWKRIVAAARPSGHRSTFYEVVGSNARHLMFNALIADGGSAAIQLALRHHRTEPIAQLVDETKVWSYWPYRQRLITILAGTAMARPERETALERCVIAWARQQPALAAALDHSPPACATEDLVVVSDGGLAAAWAANRLTGLMRAA